MSSLRKAASLWLALAALAFLSWSASVPEPTLPRWPVALRVRAPRGGPFCASRELQEALRARAFEFVSGPGRAEPRWSEELSLVCKEQRIADGSWVGGLELRSPGRAEPVYSDAFSSREAATRAQRARLAEDLATRLAQESSVVAESEKVFLSEQNGLALAGAHAFENGDWSAASRLLFQGLEGLADPAQAYYGLSVSAAKLGEPQRAWWFALAYLKESGRPVEKARLGHLKGLSPNESLDAEAGGLYADARRLIEKRQLRQAFVVLKLACEKVPWDPRPAEAVAAIYDGLSWEQPARSWRGRADIARRIASESLGPLPNGRVP